MTVRTPLTSLLPEIWYIIEGFEQDFYAVFVEVVQELLGCRVIFRTS